MRDAHKRHKSASGKATAPKTATSAPPWERIFEVDFDALARRTTPLPDEVSDLLRRFDGTRTLRAVVDESGGDSLTRFGALERDQLLVVASPAPAALAAEDDVALGAWLEDAPAAARPWLRWSIAPAAAALAIAAVALLRPASRATAIASDAPAAVVTSSSPPATSVTKDTTMPAQDTASPSAANTAPSVANGAAVANDSSAVANGAPAVANGAPAVVEQSAVVAAAAANKPAAVEPAAVAATAKVEIAPAAKSEVAKVESAAKEVAPGAVAKSDAPAAKMDAPAKLEAKADAPATVLASVSTPGMPSVAPAAKSGVGGNGAVEKDGATVAVKTSAPADPARYAALVAEGKSRYAKGQIKAARTALLAAMQLDPSRTDALVPLARCQLDSGALDDAFGNARRAIAARADDADAWLIVGAVEQQRSHAREARTAYQKYLTLAPNAAYASDVRAVLRTLR